VDSGEPQPAPDSAATSPSVGAAKEVDIALGQSGLGAVRLGMAVADYRHLHAATSGPVDSGMTILGRDEERKCTAYQLNQSGRPWVWVRGGRVVTVALGDGVPGATVTPTAFGVAVGGRLDLTGAGQDGWTMDPGAPVPVARRIAEPDVIVTIADSDADGILDFASVGTRAGDECEFDTVDAQVVPPAPAIDDSSFLGLSLGMSSAEVEALPGWDLATIVRAPCRIYTAQRQYYAYVLEETVVGIGATRTVNGPTAGQSIKEAVAALGAERTRVTSWQRIGQEWQSEVRLADGRTFTVRSDNPRVRQAGLDVAISGPVPPEERIINSVVLGRTCDSRVSG